MKLKTFNVNNAPIVRGGTTPRISINTKSGLFSINKPACELLSLKAGDLIVLHQDEESGEDWYIEKVKSDGFYLRPSKGSNSSLYFNNAGVAREIFKSINYEDKAGRVIIAGQATKLGKQLLYGLLTSSLTK